MDSRVFALSIHADYKCRHSGECCAMDWDVPVDLPIYRSLDEAIRTGRLRVSADAGGLEPFAVEPELPEDAAAILGRTAHGCVFFDRGPNLCIVHRDLGEAALPSTCRHFPRVAVRDPRGTFITLSHYCPTAASMLFREDVPVAIVDRPAAFPPADYEGLVVTGDDLPPLLGPGMLMDLPGYAAWERHMVARCAELTRRPESVLATIARDAQMLRAWKPGKGSLAEAVAGLPGGYVDAPKAETLEPSLRHHAAVMSAVPSELKPEPDEAGLAEAFAAGVRLPWDGFRAPLNRYLAGKAFASWTAYQGRGVATIVRGLEAALALVRVEAARRSRDARRPLDGELLLESFRAADFALNHLAIGEELAIGWSVAEAEIHVGKPDTTSGDVRHPRGSSRR